MRMKIANLLRVVEVLGTDLFSGYNINQVSRLSGTDVATTYRTLKEMEGKNEVTKEKKGNNFFYRLNLKNTTTLKYCELSSIEKRKSFLAKKPGIYGKISKLMETADSVVIFGSFARGEKRPRDIDLLLLYREKPNIRKIENSLKGTRISPLYMEFDEFKNKLANKDKVVMEIIKDGIILSGEYEYWKAISEAI